MWVRDGKAFVWIDKADGNTDLVGEYPITMFANENMMFARLLVPRNLNVGPEDTLSVLPIDEDVEEELGPGQWIG